MPKFVQCRSVRIQILYVAPYGANCVAIDRNKGDFTSCCIEAKCKMLKHPKSVMSYEQKKFHITGADKLTPADMMEMMSKSFNVDIQYNEVGNFWSLYSLRSVQDTHIHGVDQVDCEEWKRIMEDEKILSLMQIKLCEEIFEMVRIEQIQF